MNVKYASLRQGLVGAWCPSLGPSGHTLLDRSGYGNHGTLIGMDAPTDWVASRYGWALDFDAASDGITTSCPGIVTNERGASIWFRTNRVYSSGTYGGLIGWGTATTFPADTGKDFGIVIGNDFNLGASGIGVTQYGDALGVTGFNDGNWHHIYCDAVGSFYRVYVDGILRSTKTMTTNATAGTVKIGNFQNLFYRDLLDDGRVYARTLSSQEIRLLASEPGIGIKPERPSVFFGAQLFNAAWAKNSNQLISAGVI